MKRTDDLDPLTRAVGRRLRSLREGNGASLRELGGLADLHPFHVMDVEHGTTSPNTRTLGALARGLGVKSADLLNVDEDDHHGAIYEMLRDRSDLVEKLLVELSKTTVTQS